MNKRRIFNIVYFLMCAGVLIWLLRGQVYIRIVPVLTGLGLAFSLLLLCFSFSKHGLTVDTASIISPRRQRRLRCLAILLPIPALVYFCLYNISIVRAGKTFCSNKLCRKIARFEKAAFSKARMIDYARKVQPRLERNFRKYENQGRWWRALSCYKTLHYIKKLHGIKYSARYYGVRGALYDKMGRDKCARKYFAKAERKYAKLLNESHIGQRGTTHVVSVGRVLNMTNGMLEEYVVRDFPWTRDILPLRKLKPSEYGGRFVQLDLRPMIVDYRTPMRKGADLILTGQTVRKGLARYSADSLPSELKSLRYWHPDVYSLATNDRYGRSVSSDRFPARLGDLIPQTVILLNGQLDGFFPDETELKITGPFTSGTYKFTSDIIKRSVRAPGDMIHPAI